MYIHTVHPKKLKKNSHMYNTYYYPPDKKSPGHVHTTHRPPIPNKLINNVEYFLKKQSTNVGAHNARTLTPTHTVPYKYLWEIGPTYYRHILRLTKSPWVARCRWVRRLPLKEFVKSGTWTRVGNFHHKEPNQLSYVQFKIMLDIKTTIIFKLHFLNTPMPFKPMKPLFLIIRSILYKKNKRVFMVHHISKILLCNYIHVRLRRTSYPLYMKCL